MGTTCNIPYQSPIITFLLASCDTTNEESADKEKEEMAFGGSLLSPPRAFGYYILYTCAPVIAVYFEQWLSFIHVFTISSFVQLNI